MLATAVGFELQLHSLPADGELEQATAIWPLATGLEAFQWYSEWRETAPSALETTFATATTKMGQVATVAFVNWDPDNSSDVNEAIEVIDAKVLHEVPMCLLLCISGPVHIATSIATRGHILLYPCHKIVTDCE